MYTKVDPDTGIELYTVLNEGQEIVFSDYTLHMASRFVRDYLYADYQTLWLKGVAGGCRLCSTLGVETLNSRYVLHGKEHWRSLPHIASSLQVPTWACLKLLTEANENDTGSRLHNSSAYLLPSEDGSSNSSLLVWRGFNLSVNFNELKLLGGTNAIWHSKRLEATCLESVDRCKDHLSLGGMKSAPVISVRQGRNEIFINNNSLSGRCSCGIYAFNELKSLVEQPDLFSVLALTHAWGEIVCSSDGLRSSGSTIERAWLIKDRWIQPKYHNYIDFKRLAADLSKEYEIPVSVVKDTVDLEMWLQIEKISAKGEND